MARTPDDRLDRHDDVLASLVLSEQRGKDFRDETVKPFMSATADRFDEGEKRFRVIEARLPSKEDAATLDAARALLAEWAFLKRWAKRIGTVVVTGGPTVYALSVKFGWW